MWSGGRADDRDRARLVALNVGTWPFAPPALPPLLEHKRKCGAHHWICVSVVLRTSVNARLAASNASQAAAIFRHPEISMIKSGSIAFG
jgi:hypothetical protein